MEDTTTYPMDNQAMGLNSNNSFHIMDNNMKFNSSMRQKEGGILKK